MAQPGDSPRTTTTEASNAPKPQSSPGSKSSRSQTSPHFQHLQGGASSWSPNSSSKPKKNHDEDDHGNHHNKKSVFMKVKEKARKLKKSLSGRRRRDDNELHSPYITPPGSAGSVEDDKERPEFFGSPSYEPRVAPEANKQSAKEQPQEANNGSSENSETPSLDSSDTMVDSKLSGLAITDREGSETAPSDAKQPEEKENTSSMQPQDKGASVKEYLMNKFEPGEDERALSQVITQTISPRCERMKEAMNSFLGNEEESSHDSISNSSKLELDITPSSSSIESPDKKASSSNNHPNLSSTLEQSLSNASNISQCSAPSSASDNPNSNSSANDTRNPASTSSHQDTKDNNS